MGQRAKAPTEVAPAGNLYDKYRTSNPAARRLVGRFLIAFDELVSLSGARATHEVGCGEGELAVRLARRGLAVRASDAALAAVAEARRRAAAAAVRIDFEATPIESLTPVRHAAPLVVCCEVLEHVAEPQAALAKVAALARPWALLSVPREPVWRALNVARGAYLGRLGNTPGHRRQWSKRAFLDLLAGDLDIVAVRAPLPWTMALCRAR